ncbi:MAG TPA: AsnC family transcriptional regulator [Sporomusaceae bacterium]|jgi:DNA-binding Lrp family transcriptional regulator|uniref:Lrp/AsnC family transcriptional regulator n=1 Tax=Anaerospora sp. TaxID=1960278 RepID=UPI000EC74D75|nr:Lrp/AsnC family transcriptional regulator [Anaerospora sp.]MDF2927947.1 transcriptional regulator, AsnC family [Anaerospora sp.]HAK72532.1 AsnC family transcriptional regulator [Sporomusaceae bacterium]
MKELLEILDKEPALPLNKLAIMLDTPENELAETMKRLEDEKIIIKRPAIINWEKAGIDNVTAVIDVKITPQRESGFDFIAERIYRFPEVHSVSLMSGAYDLLVIIQGQTLKEVAQFVSDKLATIDGVISTTTHFMLKKYKEAGVIIEDDENDHRLVITP